MLATGFARADVENDFLRARRHQVMARLGHRLRRDRGDRILSLDQVISALGRRGQRYLGLRTVQVDSIIGTAESRRDFDRRFRPTSNRVRPRWEQLALAERRGTQVPPIEVYRVGDLHFVQDGHHRVSIAAATGQQVIDAYVTEVRTAEPVTGQGQDLGQGRSSGAEPADRSRWRVVSAAAAAASPWSAARRGRHGPGPRPRASTGRRC
jgi:hypothetical protein